MVGLVGRRVEFHGMSLKLVTWMAAGTQAGTGKALLPVDIKLRSMLHAVWVRAFGGYNLVRANQAPRASAVGDL